MKNEKKHSGWFWLVLACGVVFLSLIQKPLSISMMRGVNPYDATSLMSGQIPTVITMIVFALLIFFIARKVDAHFGYPHKNGDVENEDNNDEMQKMQKGDTEQQ